ncbi:MAG: trypsin-like peptidase domain-containing protein [Planctomycetota bacterium]
MNRSACALRSLASAWLLLAALRAQAPAVDPDEFVRLEPVLQAAIQRAAPWTVTVETFGGTRRVMGEDGEFDGDAPPKPKQRPKKQPEPDKKEGEPKDEQDPKDGKGEKGEKPDLPLVAPGFAQAQGRTTGVVIRSDGWIVVSRFALNLDPTTVLVTVPGRGTFRAERVGEDTSRGIALVKIPARDLPVPTMLHPDSVQVGQWACALGRTFAVDEPTVHLGIVSAKHRLFGRALQIDAYTSPANYGGPVIDLEGRLLGIAVPLSPSGRNAGVEWYDSGIGFATTLADIEPLLARMQDGAILQRGWLGVRLEPSFLGPGAKIASISETGAAAKAGVKAGDVVTAVDGIAVKNGPHLQMLVNARLGGDFVSLGVQRGDEALRFGPFALLDAPWSEQKGSKDQEQAPSFPPLRKPEGR